MKIILILFLFVQTLLAQSNLLLLMGDDAVVSRNVFKELITAGARNNYTGSVGFEFTTGKDITINKMGRVINVAMASSHKIILWRVSDQEIIAQVTVTTSSPVDELGYVYEDISQVTLPEGVTYRIASNETNLGDLWGEGVVDGSFYYTDEITITQQVYGLTDAYPGTGVGASSIYVPPTFYVIQ